MNNSQLLYKISNLQYTIRMKEAEYARAVNAGEKLTIDLNSNALTTLRTDLAAAIEEYNTSPVQDFSDNPKTEKKAKWWQTLFNFKTADTKF